MFRRSTNRTEAPHSPARLDGQTVTDPSYQSPVTSNHSTTTSVGIAHPVNNLNGICASQPQSQPPLTNSSPSASCPNSLNQPRQQSATAESFRVVFDTIESELLQYPRDPGRMAGQPVHNRSQSIRVARSDCERVCRQYFALRSARIADKIKISLSLHTFNNWLHSDAQLIAYLKFMFIDLDLPRLCRFPVEVLETWLLAVYRRYNDVPFHNFKHAFMVTQMMYALIKQADLVSCFAPLDLLILLFSALSHDLDHPGFTNSYQVNARSWLSLRYNDISPLENHHCAVAFDLVSHPATNLLVGLTPAEYQWFRKAVIRCILATDMANHKDCVQQFRTVIPNLLQAVRSHTTQIDRSVDGIEECGTGPDRDDAHPSDRLCAKLAEDPDSRLTVMLILLKTCDISNEARPTPVADPWLDCLLNEFFFQAMAEKQSGLPVLPHMDPEKVTRASSQLGFIRHVLLPLLQDLVTLFPSLKPLEAAAHERIFYFELMERQADANEPGTFPHTQEDLGSASSSLLTRTTPQPFTAMGLSCSHPSSGLRMTHPTRSCSLGTNAAPRFDNDALARVGKLRCLSTPIHHHAAFAQSGSLPLNDVIADTAEPRSEHERCSHDLLVDFCPTSAVARDGAGTKRHLISQPLSAASRLLLNYNSQLELPVQRDPDHPLSDSVVVTAVSRKSSTGSMVAALN